MTTNAVHANFRYNGLSPNAVGHGRGLRRGRPGELVPGHAKRRWAVIIPSFHRPAAIRQQYNANGTVVSTTGSGCRHTSTAADLGRLGIADPPPAPADGHDPTRSPTWSPTPTGQITYDVDNDGDGLTDSVWVDLGYPARRNAQGQLYKPLFAFMVIGLNGRIPLNTAGNLAGGRRSNGGDPRGAPGQLGQRDRPDLRAPERVRDRPDARGLHDLIVTRPSWLEPQIGERPGDSGGIDVRLTQLRNLLAGTRPQPNPTAPFHPRVTDPTGQINGDNNFVLFNGVPLLHAQRDRRPRPTWTASARARPVGSSAPRPGGRALG